MTALPFINFYRQMENLQKLASNNYIAIHILYSTQNQNFWS